MTSRDTIKVSNVIRTMVPGRIVKQYLAYCEEAGFKPLSRSTLVRILNVCSASVRKSLQGLDYFSSSGAQAFDDLRKVAEILGDAGQGMGWAKKQQGRLRESKRYLKSDYKYVSPILNFYYKHKHCGLEIKSHRMTMGPLKSGVGDWERNFKHY